MPKKHTIGITMIAKNESSCLETCLESVKGFDAIYLADTGSTDNTIEIAKKFTDKVYTDFVWCDDFAKARNFILSKAETDWILIIDCDEFLVTPIEEVYKIVEDAEAKGLKILDISMISTGRPDEHLQPRLFKRCPEIFWGGAIHNYMSILGQEKVNVVIKYGYSAAHEGDPDRSFRILTKVVEEDSQVTVQIASVPWRVDMLKQTVESLRPQVDKIFVALNGYDSAPIFLNEGEYILLDNSTGDAAKFYGVENIKGYVFLCDDDLVYPPDYVKYMIEGMKRNKSVVSLHGYTYPEVYTSHTDRLNTYHCLGKVAEDTVVDVGGTGVMAFHSSQIKIKYSDFTEKNMADVFFSKIAREQGVPITVLKHNADYLTYLNPRGTIYEEQEAKGFEKETQIEKEIFIQPKHIKDAPVVEVGREKYYLAREYFYREDYITALHWYDEYLKVEGFLAEVADAYVMAGYCSRNKGQWERARQYCLQAIEINANFKEALLLMAELSFEKNAVQWRLMAQSASNEDVLFIKN